MKKRLMCVFLSVLMVFTINFSAFAETSSTNIAEQVTDDEITASEKYADYVVDETANPIAITEIGDSIDSIALSESETEPIEMDLPELEAAPVFSELISSSEPIGNIADFKEIQEISLNQSRTRTVNEEYYTYEGYINDPTQYDGCGLSLAAGYYLQVQMNQPNTSAIDYDLLLTVLIDGELYLLDVSENTTLINGSYGTLPETVGWYNNSGSTQVIYILAASKNGSSSSSMPYIFHIGADTVVDSFEPDAIFDPVTITLPAANASGELSSRRLLTRADNDWYRFTVPTGSKIQDVYLSLDSASASKGHKVEMYTYQNGKASRCTYTTVSAGSTYYIRVHTNQGELLPGNYKLTISPWAPYEPPVLTTLTIPRTNIPANSGVIVGTVNWIDGGSLDFKFDEPTSYRTVIELDIPPNGWGPQFFLSEATSYSIPMNYLQTSYTARILIYNDDYSAFTLSGTITSYGK